MSAARRRREETRADRVIRFCEEYLIIPEGMHVGQPVRLLEFQKQIFRDVYGSPTRRAIISMPRKNGKALALDTPLPTPTGWTTMGEVAAGDTVFDGDGMPCRVTDVSPVHINNPCYRIVFSNGEEVVADADHQWVTTARIEQPGRRTRGPRGELTRVRTTSEIAKTLTCGTRGDRNHSIRMPGPLSPPESDLPVDPYVLGYWLGDGDTDEPTLTVGSEDLDFVQEQMAAAGLVTTTRWGRTAWRITIQAGQSDLLGVINSVSRRSPYNLRFLLRQIGVIGNKCIPPMYLRASIDQRLSLLQGLMDSDGCVVSKGVGAEFVTTKARLAEGFAELLASFDRPPLGGPG